MYIGTFYSPFEVGGAEITLKLLVDGIYKRGHEVKVLSFWDKNNKEELVDGVRVYRAKIPNIYLPYGKYRPHFLKRRVWHALDVYNPISKKIVFEQAKDFKPDVVSIHNIQGWSCAVWDAINELGIPAIQVLHDLNLLCPTHMFKNGTVCRKQCMTCKFMRYPHKFKSNKLKAVVGVSKFVIDKHLNYGYFTDLPIKEVIYNSRKIDNSIHERKPDDKYVNLGFIGALEARKGIELLLRTYQKIKKSNYRLFIAGAGKQDYEEYLKMKYKDDSIVFMGKVKPKDFFEKVDVAIVPSIWYENFPGVIIESFAFGVPVIGSNIGGIPEMIADGINGILFDPYKEGDLEEKLAGFIDEISYWRNRSEIIKQSGKKFLDYNRWIDKWEELYKLVAFNNV